MIRGDEWLQAEADRAARGRAAEEAYAKAKEGFTKAIFALGYECGRDAQLKVNVGVAQRLLTLLREAKVQGTRYAEGFVKEALQIWSTPGERFVSEETEAGDADPAGRGDDLQAIGDGSGEEAVRDPHR